MELLPGDKGARPVCQAVVFGEFVDAQMNGGARREFAAATSALQPLGADLGEGSAFLDDSSVTFDPQSVVCGLCRGMVRLSRDGGIDSPCPASGFCEQDFVKAHEGLYAGEDGEPAARSVACRATLGCGAIVNLARTSSGGIEPSIKDGTSCRVTIQGANWRVTRDNAIKGMKLRDPTRGIEKFDGEGSGRE